MASVCASAQVAQQPDGRHVGERHAAGQIRSNRSVPRQRLEAALHEDPGRVLTAVFRRLDEARRLAQLRQTRRARSSTGAKVEQGLSGQARPQQLPVHLRFRSQCRSSRVRASAPGYARQSRAAPPVRARQRVGADGRQPPCQTGQRLHLALDSAALEVLEQVVVEVTPSKVAAEGLVSYRTTVVVDEVMKRSEAIMLGNREKPNGTLN